MQGFMFAYPMPADDLVQWLEMPHERFPVTKSPAKPEANV